MCQVLIDVKNTGDWQFGFKKNLRELVSKTSNIHDTKNEVFR